MKQKLLLLLFLTTGAFYSCDDTTLVADYDLALIVGNDTTQIADLIPNFDQLPAGYPFPTGLTQAFELDPFPFYLGDFTDEGQTIKELMPLINLSENFPLGSSFGLTLYVKNASNVPNYFWADKNYVVKSVTDLSTKHVIPKKDVNGAVSDPGIKPIVISEIKDSKELFVSIKITFPAGVTKEQIKACKMITKISIRTKLATEIAL